MDRWGRFVLKDPAAIASMAGLRGASRHKPAMGV
jgi:hypothetical protein